MTTNPTNPTDPAADDGELREDGNPHFWVMVDCVRLLRRTGEADPVVAVLARALTATVNGRPAAARVWLTKAAAMLDHRDGSARVDRTPAPEPVIEQAEAAERRQAILDGRMDHLFRADDGVGRLECGLCDHTERGIGMFALGRYHLIGEHLNDPALTR